MLREPLVLLRAGLAGVLLHGAVVVGQTTIAEAAVDSVAALCELAARPGCARVGGYADPGDGGSGVFWWRPESEAAEDGGTVFRSKHAAAGRWHREVPDGVLNVKWFGAKGDGDADDTDAIVRAIAVATDRERGRGGRASAVVYFPPGTYYTYRQITIDGGPVTLQGAHALSSVIRYMGEDFVDLLHIDLSKAGKARGVRILDLGFYGGEYLKGRARYCIYGKWFTSYCQIRRCQIRDGVGLLKLDGCWYGEVSNNSIHCVNPKPEHLTAEQIAEVHGPESAPIYCTGGGSFRFHKNAMNRLALSDSMPTPTHRCVFVHSQATDFSNCSIESVWDERTPEHVLWISGVVNIGQLYAEKVSARRAFLIVEGGSTVSSVSRAMLYRTQAGTLFMNESVGDLVVRDTLMYRVMGDRLFHVGSPAGGSMQSDVLFENCTTLAGERYQTSTNQLAAFDTVGTRLPERWKFRWDPERKGTRESWYASARDDGDWAEIGVTSHWGEQPVGRAWKEKHGSDYQGIAWYRTRFKVEEPGPDGRGLLLFGAVDAAAQIWLNDTRVFDRAFYDSSWQDPFEVDVTAAVRPGTDNVLAVRVDNVKFAGGIWKPVWLVVQEGAGSPLARASGLGRPQEYYDTAGSGFSPFGIRDGTPGRRNALRCFPEVLEGYDVRFGKDAKGPYVKVDAGVLRTESGGVVRNKQLAYLTEGGGEPGKPLPPEAVFRYQVLRFESEASARHGKWYRLHVGRAGQPYLVKHDARPTGKGGTWLREFRLSQADEVTGESVNPLLSLRGGYPGGVEAGSVHHAAQPPRAGNWLRGDRVLNTVPAPGGAVGWICVEAGAPGAWRSYGTVASE